MSLLVSRDQVKSTLEMVNKNIESVANKCLEDATYPQFETDDGDVAILKCGKCGKCARGLIVRTCIKGNNVIGSHINKVIQNWNLRNPSR